MTPNGHAGTHIPQPLHTSSCTTTVPNSVRNSAPGGQTSRQAAWVQWLQTSDDISHRKSGTVPSAAAAVACAAAVSGSTGGGDCKGLGRGSGTGRVVVDD